MRHSILATLLAATALIPSAALAQRGDDDRRGDRGFDRTRSGVTVESRIGVGQDRAERAERPDRPQAQAQAQPRADRGDDGPRADRGGRGRGNGEDRGGADRPGQGGYRPAPVVQNDRGDFRGGNTQWRGNDDRDGRADRRDGDGPRGAADWRGNDGRGGNQWRGNDRRPDIRGNQRNWNRGWRQDNRYDWNRRRQVNRNAFHLPRYYAPGGWGYGYRRFNVGFTLNAGLFNRNYWIDDADYNGLPAAYGPYRWVRYYNDALLVDVYSGQIVDTVYDIFW